ncbi:MAG: SDR family oxidoreductase [Candidatus Pacebacteria bacterium]|nr:SDR family oxidoreductase [Candidatus Paceibacterota bacterium]
MKLDKKVALITGGSNGIGKAIAQRFLDEGAKVIIFDIVKPDYDVDFYEVDISNEEQIKKAFQEIKHLDIVVNNAGIYFQASIEETSKEQLDKIIDVNFKGAYLISKYALPLVKKGKGNIINISSVVGIIPDPTSPAYCSTKAALIMLTKCMAREYGIESVRVNAILPGPIDTPLLRRVLFSEELIQKYTALNPMGRIGKPEEVANVAAFLASNEASYVTGGIYSVDGGQSC